MNLICKYWKHIWEYSNDRNRRWCPKCGKYMVWLRDWNCWGEMGDLTAERWNDIKQ
jgi:hypothetical protein